MGKGKRKEKSRNRGSADRSQGISMSSEPGSLSASEEGLYPSALEEMERKLLKRAREVEGLDEEIALLRVKLALALTQEPKNTELLLKGLTVLIRAVATKARYSPKAEEDLCKNILSVLRGLGNTLFPENFEEPH